MEDCDQLLTSAELDVDMDEQRIQSETGWHGKVRQRRYFLAQDPSLRACHAKQVST